MPDRLPYLVEPMTLADITEVMAIEQVAFSAPWSARAYRFEIEENDHSVMLVVRPAPRFDNWLVRGLRRLNLWRRAAVLGHAGMWLLVDDAHIATIAVHPAWRGKGLGELLLSSLLDRAIELGAQRATLEVRVSNVVAQQLYVKYGFQKESRRRHYYADNNEDAYIMATPGLASDQFQAYLGLRQQQLVARLRDETHGPREHSPAVEVAGCGPSETLDDSG